MKARRCAKFSGKGNNKHCARYKKVSVSTAKGKRVGSNYFKGDRIKRGSWGVKRWARARNIDSKRSGRKYEDWERKSKRLSWR